MDGPMICVALRERLSSAFACWRRPGLIVCGTRPLDAGAKNALAAPLIAAPTAICQSWAVPVSSR